VYQAFGPLHEVVLQFSKGYVVHAVEDLLLCLSLGDSISQCSISGVKTILSPLVKYISDVVSCQVLASFVSDTTIRLQCR